MEAKFERELRESQEGRTRPECADERQERQRGEGELSLRELSWAAGGSSGGRELSLAELRKIHGGAPFLCATDARQRLGEILGASFRARLELL
jgi:hypothetical protein